MKTKITHLEKTFETIHFSNISDEKCLDIKKQFYEKPSLELVHSQFLKVYNGGKKTNHIIDYYFKDVMSKARLSTSKWSIKEFFDAQLPAAAEIVKKQFLDALVEIARVDGIIKDSEKAWLNNISNVLEVETPDV